MPRGRPRLKTFADPRDRNELLERLALVRHDSVRRWGTMTPHQMICHLRDAFLMGTNEMPVQSLAGWPQRTVVKWMALYGPWRWPPGIRTAPEVDQEKDGTRPYVFDDDVAALNVVMFRAIRETSFFRGREHPVFGPLSEAGWMRWAYLHTDHHLRQFGL